MSKLCQLFSGSSGNSTYIGTGNGGILIDVGVSAKRLEGALNQLNIDPRSIQGIFLTHEHRDHIAGLRVFAGRYHIPAFASEGTLLSLEQAGELNEKFPAYILDMPELPIGDFCVSSFRTSHDSAESCGYRVTLPDGQKIAVCTDLGFVSQSVKQGILGCNAVVLESNHDPDMLSTGPYPYYLKERIRSRRGHLSNGDCAALLPELIESGTTRLILSHLSKENNTPLLAGREAEFSLTSHGMQKNRDYLLAVAPECGGQPILL